MTALTTSPASIAPATWNLVSSDELTGSTDFSRTIENTFQAGGVEIKEVVYTDRYFSIKTPRGDMIIAAGSPEDALAKAQRILQV